MSAPVLRSQSFIWSAQGVVPSGFNALAGAWAVGWLQDSASADAALLVLPAWPSVLQPEAPLALSNPYRIAEELFGDLAGETGFSAGNINLVATAIAVEPGTDEPLLALQLSDASDPNFENHDPDGVLLPLINLEQLSAPVDSLAPLPASAFAPWTSLLPDEQITQLLHLPALGSEPEAWVVLGSTTGDGAVVTAYHYDDSSELLSYAWPKQRVAGTDSSVDLNSQVLDGAVNPLADDQASALLLASIATLPTHDGLIPSGGQDVLLTSHGADGSLQWASLFGNASLDQTPQVAVAPTGDVVVAATLFGGLGDRNPAPAADDLGIAIASYSPDGTLLWQQRLADAADPSNSQVATDLLVMPDGMVLLLGGTVDANGAGLHGQAAVGDGSDVDAFLTAFSPSGDRLWTHQFGSSGDDWARAMALVPIEEADGGATTSLVVVGDQQFGASPQAWVELIELADTAAIQPQYLAPSPPTLSLNAGADAISGLPHVIVQAIDAAGTHRIQLAGQAEPGSTVRLSTSLAVGSSEVSADPSTGEWSLLLELPNLTNPGALAEGYVQLEAIRPQSADPAVSSFAAVSDLVREAVQFVASGTGLPGGLPQQLPIDPDGGGPGEPVLLQRSYTVAPDAAITQEGDRLLVDYSGRLEDGTPFDSSLNPGRTPFGLTLGEGRVIQGWDQGLQGVPIGSSLQLVIPSELGYGASGSPPTIPGDATLIFDVDVRANLSEAEAFLSKFVWTFGLPSTYDDVAAELLTYYRERDPYYAAYAAAGFGSSREATYNDILDFALINAAADGTEANEVLALAKTDSLAATFPSLSTSISSDLLPRLALAASGDDQLEALGQSAFLYGEAGDDVLASHAAYYTVLDAGDGDDILMPTSVLSLVRGGPGTDQLLLAQPATGQTWGQSTPVTIGDTTYGVLLRQGEDISTGSIETYQVILYAPDVEGVQYQSTISLYSESLSAISLLDVLDRNWLPVTLEAQTLSLRGTAQQLSGLEQAAQAGDLAGLNAASYSLSNASLSGSELLQLLDGSVAQVDASSIQVLDVSLPQVVDLLALQDSGRLQLADAVTFNMSYEVVDAQSLIQLLSRQEDFVVDASLIQAVDVSLQQVVDLLALQDSGRLQLADAVTFNMSYEVVDAQSLIQLLSRQEDFVVDASLIQAVDVSLQQVVALLDLHDSGRLQLADAVTFNLSDEVVDAQDFDRLLSRQDGFVLDASGVASLLGSADKQAAILDSSRVIKPASVLLQAVDALGRVYGPNEQIHYTLSFSAPVQWLSNEGNSESIDLQVNATHADGVSSLAASLVDSHGGEFSSSHQLDVLTGTTPDDQRGVQIDSITGTGAWFDQWGRPVEISALESYQLRNAPDVSSVSWSMDIDGDGRVSAFTDGLLVIRKLLGPAFAGDALIDKALSPGAKLRSSAGEISDYIQTGIDAGYLDVDRDGRTNAFSDGLLIIRNLLGTGFEGSSLLGNALSPNSKLLPDSSVLAELSEASRLEVADQIVQTIDSML